MELTRERIDAILKELKTAFQAGHKLDAIKIIREPLGFYLRQAKDYIEIHWNDLEFIRKDLEERAGLTPEVKMRVFETPLFRLEIKRTDVTQEQLHNFFSNIALEL